MTVAIPASEPPKRVDVIVPCRNERSHITAFAESVLAQQIPAGWSLGIVVADGMSDDGTRDILRGLAERDPRVRWVDNPMRIVSAGLNRALAGSSGDIVVRMDVHTEYAPDYVARCIEALDRTGADSVGGPWRAEAQAGAGATQQAIAAAFQSPIVAGGALSRRLDYDGPADTVYLGAWRRDGFARFGPFDETLVRNQDDEHNLRILRAGGRVWQSSAIRSVYRPRATFGQVFRQYMQYGYWKPFVMKKHGQPARLRQLAPACLVLAFAAAAVAALTGAGPWPLAMLALVYGAAVAAMCLGVARSARLPTAVLARLPLVIGIYHFSYGLGSILGWIDVLTGRGGRERFARLTR